MTAMLDPDAAERERVYTPEEIQEREEARLAILHPHEYQAFVEPAETPEQKAARDQAREEISNPVRKPVWLRTFVTEPPPEGPYR